MTCPLTDPDHHVQAEPVIYQQLTAPVSPRPFMQVAARYRALRKVGAGFLGGVIAEAVSANA